MTEGMVCVIFSDDLHDARNTITEQNRRLHELEIELRRLENEREELSAAYKEAEAVGDTHFQRMQNFSPTDRTTLDCIFYRAVKPKK